MKSDLFNLDEMESVLDSNRDLLKKAYYLTVRERFDEAEPIYLGVLDEDAFNEQALYGLLLVYTKFYTEYEDEKIDKQLRIIERVFGRIADKKAIEYLNLREDFFEDQKTAKRKNIESSYAKMYDEMKSDLEQMKTNFYAEDNPFKNVKNKDSIEKAFEWYVSNNFDNAKENQLRLYYYKRDYEKGYALSLKYIRDNVGFAYYYIYYYNLYVKDGMKGFYEYRAKETLTHDLYDLYLVPAFNLQVTEAKTEMWKIISWSNNPIGIKTVLGTSENVLREAKREGDLNAYYLSGKHDCDMQRSSTNPLFGYDSVIYAANKGHKKSKEYIKANQSKFDLYKYLRG